MAHLEGDWKNRQLRKLPAKLDFFQKSESLAEVGKQHNLKSEFSSELEIIT